MNGKLTEEIRFKLDLADMLLARGNGATKRLFQPPHSRTLAGAGRARG
jgi:hypothetical protein